MSMEHWWKDKQTANTEVVGKKPAPAAHHQSQIPHGLAGSEPGS
jgi:hypothetical protein